MEEDGIMKKLVALVLTLILCMGIIPAMAERLATQPQLLAPQSYQLILPADIEAAAKTYVSPTGNMPHRKAIGFCA